MKEILLFLFIIYNYNWSQFQWLDIKQENAYGSLRTNYPVKFQSKAFIGIISCRLSYGHYLHTIKEITLTDFWWSCAHIDNYQEYINDCDVIIMGI